VPGLNSTRAEARERSAHIQMHSYQVTLDVTTGEVTFLSKTVAKFSCINQVMTPLLTQLVSA